MTNRNHIAPLMIQNYYFLRAENSYFEFESFENLYLFTGMFVVFVEV